MSEEEVLAQLRDIHFPAELAAGTSLAFALWPFMVLAGVVVLVLIMRHLGRNAWRRRAKDELETIIAIEDPASQWALLLAFATTLSERAGRSVSLPEVAYLRPEAIGERERTVLVAHLRGELAR